MTNQNPRGSSAIRNEQWAVENMGFDEKKALRFEENARLPRLNECRSTSKSKQSVFPGFSTKNIRADLTRNDKRLHQSGKFNFIRQKFITFI